MGSHQVKKLFWTIILLLKNPFLSFHDKGKIRYIFFFIIVHDEITVKFFFGRLLILACTIDSLFEGDHVLRTKKINTRVVKIRSIESGHWGIRKLHYFNTRNFRYVSRIQWVLK